MCGAGHRRTGRAFGRGVLAPRGQATRMADRRGVYRGRSREGAQMAQVSAARRAAEQAARKRLAGPLIGAVGELGVAVAARETAAAGVPAAQERAGAHVRRAQAEAQELVAAAHAQVAAADDGYRAAHRVATDAGWSAAALVLLGSPQPRSPGTRPPRSRAAAPRAASARAGCGGARTPGTGTG